MSQLALDLIYQNQRTRSTSLDLGKTGLRELPYELYQCVWLQELTLCDEYWDAEANSWIKSSNNGETNSIEFIPTQIAFLRNLETLRLGGSGTNIWPLAQVTFAGLHSLEKLYICYTHIKDTNFALKLINLRELILSCNDIHDLYGLHQLSGLRNLDLENNENLDIEKLRPLIGLRKLNISRNIVTQIMHLQNLGRLEALEARATGMTNIEFISELINLQKLDVSYNSISDIRQLEFITKLRFLDLSHNDIAEIHSLSKLKSLTELNLSHNNIFGIHSLHDLVKLNTLDISFNRLYNVQYVNSLPKLTVLKVRGNRLNDVLHLKDVVGLNWLDLGENRILKIQGIEHLVGLKNLYLDHNEIKEIDDLKNMSKLTNIDLGFNAISNILILSKLNSLETINLSRNKISIIKNLGLISKLKSINLYANSIEDVEPLLPLLTKREFPMKMVLKSPAEVLEAGEINLAENPLLIPPVEIVEQGNVAVINYLNEIRKKGKDYLYEAKMLIVGQPRSGKTSLRYKLHDINSPLPGEDKTTRGIDIQQLEFDIVDKEGNSRKFKYNIWDFGGQQIYHATHQFFLTNRSLYVLVLDTGKDSTGNDDATINYWLQAVELLGGNSPMLLIKNEKNNRQISLDIKQKKARFPFLKNDYDINLDALIPNSPTFSEGRKSDFKKLQEDIEFELKRLPLVGFPMPANWVNIRNELYKRSEKSPYMTRESYIELCIQYEVYDFEKQMELSKIFHDLGVFLHFQGYDILEDFIILQNVWATDAVFAVLDNEFIKSKKGKFTEREVAEIWNRKYFDVVVHRKLLALMMQFELCYQLVQNKEPVYIVPEMLDNEKPLDYNWNPNNDLVIFYIYDFMPKGLLTRLIVRLNQHITRVGGNQAVWKTGVQIDGRMLDCPNSFIEITEAWDNRQLMVRAQGTFGKDLMSKVTFQIDLMNSEFFKIALSEQKSKWYKMVPCNCAYCKEHADGHLFDFSILLKAKELEKDIQCQKTLDDIKVTELLDGIFANYSKDLPTTKSKKVAKPSLFISYSHSDEYWKDELVKNLAPLKNNNLINEWHDRDIEAGQWDEQIESAMQKTDIFLLLVTHNFLSSAYINSQEIKTAFSRYKTGKAKIFPIICDSCSWQLQPVTDADMEYHPEEKRDMLIWLGKFQAFPKDGKPIKNWSNQQDGFLDVVNQLKKYL